MESIIFRDADFKIIHGMEHAPLLCALKREGLERIDVWPAGRKATVGFAWADGATGIGDVPWEAEALIAWIEQRGHGRLVRHHLGRKAAA